MQLIKKYWFYVALPLSVIFGWFVIGDMTYTKMVEPSSPYMIVDKDVPSEYCPVGYEPVELTGKPVEQGERAMINCKVPESYEKYVHYPENWQENALNPESWQGQATKWALYGVLFVVIGLVSWRSVRLYRKYKKNKTGGIQ